MAMTHPILWRRLDLPGHEYGRLDPRGDGWELSGTAVFLYQDSPCRLDYLVACDAHWRTTSARVTGSVGVRNLDLSASADGDGHWRLNGKECPAVTGCIDIDLGFSPSTNLLPIRRLSLAVGQEAAVSAAWLPFPSLVFECLPQVYRREGENTYCYTSGGGRFVRTLQVNPAGFVTNYPGLWQQEAP
jgi:hypothetical protein